MFPFLWPYYQVDQAHGLARDVSVVTQYNAGWRDYLVTGGRLHFAWWSHVFYEGRTALFPGVTAIVLAAIADGDRPRDPRAARRGWRWRSACWAWRCRSARRCPDTPCCIKRCRSSSGLRNVARWGWLALAAFAILAGFGVAAVEKLAPRRRWIAVALGALVTIEAIRTPVGFTRFDGIPQFYDRLAGDRSLILAEFPFYSGASVSLNGPYVLANTRYFRPLMNGYSSFHPESFEARGRALNSFPSQAALAELQGCPGSRT